jgi:hypothetical protein
MTAIGQQLGDPTQRTAHGDRVGDQPHVGADARRPGSRIPMPVASRPEAHTTDSEVVAKKVWAMAPANWGEAADCASRI